MINARKIFLTVVNDHLAAHSKIETCVQYKEESSRYLVQYSIGTMHDSYESQFDSDQVWDKMSVDDFTNKVDSMIEEIRLEIGKSLIACF